MRTVAVIQARLGSTRLPGKVLLDLGGRPMLERVVERTRRASIVDEVVVATTAAPLDDPLAELAAARGWACVRGSEADVLDRFVVAARASDADEVVRITSDCPLIDAAVIDEVVRGRRRADADYASNFLARRTYPRGLDVECMTRGALERAAAEADQPHEREHVTPYLYADPARFRLHGHEAPEDHSALRWTVDTHEDLQLLRELYAAFDQDGPPGWRDVLAVVTRRPELAALNAHVRQKPLVGPGP